MKIKNIFTFAFALIAITLFSLPAFAQIDTDNPSDVEGLNALKKEAKTQVAEAFQVPIDFQRAVQEGDLKTIKKFVLAYPEQNLLATPIEDKDGKKVQPICFAAKEGDIKLVSYIVGYEPKLLSKECGNKEYESFPICIAAANGNTAMVEFMAKKQPESLNFNCKGKAPSRSSDFYPKGKKALWIAIANGHIDTALSLISLGSPVEVKNFTSDIYGYNMGVKADEERPVLLCVAARVFREEKDLERLIPALLDAGANPNQVTGYTNTWSADAFLFAAEKKNDNFVRILRDEMKKRGKTPVSYYYKWECVRHDYEYLQEYKRWFKEEIEFLQKYGVDYKYGFRELSYEYCRDFDFD